LRHFTPRVSASGVGESFLLQDELFDLAYRSIPALLGPSPKRMTGRIGVFLEE
jgi:hypothetical protein